MKYISILSLMVMVLVSCQNSETAKEQPADNQAVIYELYEVSIEGMTCTGCEETIKKGVTGVEGVGAVEASHVDGNAQVKFIEGKTDTASVRKAIEASGYKVTGFKHITEGTTE